MNIQCTRCSTAIMMGTSFGFENGNTETLCHKCLDDPPTLCWVACGEYFVLIRLSAITNANTVKVLPSAHLVLIRTIEDIFK